MHSSGDKSLEEVKDAAIGVLQSLERKKGYCIFQRGGRSENLQLAGVAYGFTRSVCPEVKQ